MKNGKCFKDLIKVYFGAILIAYHYEIKKIPLL